LPRSTTWKQSRFPLTCHQSSTGAPYRASGFVLWPHCVSRSTTTIVCSRRVMWSKARRSPIGGGREDNTTGPSSGQHRSDIASILNAGADLLTVLPAQTTMTGSCARSSRSTRQMLPAEIHFSPPLSTITCSSVSSVNRLPAASAVTGQEIFDALANALWAFSRPNFSADGGANWRGKASVVAKLGRQRVGCVSWPLEQAKIPGRQRRYCYGCSAYSLSPGLYPETLSWALQYVLKRADIPEERLKVRSGDWRISRGLSHGIPR
jgi:hypothetical protein